jgi:anti-sigma regulatory factor (Ser/Thr protein kinase)
MTTQEMTTTTKKSEAIFEFRRSVSADLDALEAIALEFRDSLAHCCCARDAFASELIFREALTNSVLHGCGLDPERRVSLVIRVRCDRLVIAVAMVLVSTGTNA